MPVIPILPTDSAVAVEYKIYLAGQVALLQTEHARLKKWRAYYAGSHDLLLSDDQKAFLTGLIDDDETDWPIDNKCRKVVDKVRARLNVTGWQLPDGSRREFGEGQPLGTDALNSAVAWWLANDMDRWEGEVYRAALRDEESYLIVDHDGAGPRFTFARRWDGVDGIRMRYADDGRTRPLYAIKYWHTLDPVNVDASNVLRATIYTADVVYKYARLTDERKAQWFTIAGPRTDDGFYPVRDPQDTAWPLPWRDGDGAPLGLAVVPFVSPRGSLVEAVLGLNNALNKTNLDALALADQQGFGQIVLKYDQLPSSGTAESDDPAGDGLGLRPGRVLETTGTPTKLLADDLKGLLDYARHLTVSIASNADIPLHEFVPTTNEAPSGAALQMLDAALAGQAEECTVWFTGAWRRVMQLAQRLGRLYGGYQAEPVDLAPVWKDTRYQDEASEHAAQLQEAQRLKALVDAGLPLETALRELGWDDARIAAMAAAREAEQAAAQASLASALAEQQRRFDQNAGGA